MQQRCLNQNSPSFKYYGARGIKVCRRWRGQTGFKNFVADMGERPYGHEIDRINTDGDYCKANCQWLTKREHRYKTTRERRARLATGTA